MASKDSTAALKPVIYATFLFSLVSLGLNGAIFGMRSSEEGAAFQSFEERKNSNKPKNRKSVQPAITNGACEVLVRLQEEGEAPPDGVPGWHQEDNIIVNLPGSDCDDVGVSPTWTIADYEHTIVSIAPNAVFNPPALAENERHFVKMMRGSVIDINYDGIFINGHWETFVATIPNRAIPFRIDSSVTDIKAGANGAVIMYMKVAEEALLVPITSMTEAPTTNIAGPFAEKLFWTQFGDYYASFATKQFWNLAGILIQDSDENRVCNIQWWTLREDSDADGYHNHGGMTSDNTFGELHMALYTGNQISGMQTSLPKTKNLNYVPTPVDATGEEWTQNDQDVVQIAMPWAPGAGHGPLWSVDPDTGEPTLDCNGGIVYPYHRQLISSVEPSSDPLRFTLWMVYEHHPDDVHVPLQMLTQWPNAYLQTTMEGCANILN